MRCLKLALMSLLLSPIVARGVALPDGSALKVEITIAQQALTPPLSAWVTLHMHNSGGKTLWLYRPVTAARPASSERTSETPQDSSGRTSLPIEGSTVAVRLEGMDHGATISGRGQICETVGMPIPKLIRLAPGDDIEIKTVIRLLPAQVEIGGATRSVWGQYKLVVTYAAKFSNADELERILGVSLWQGTVESNSVELDLQPGAATPAGAITGTVSNPDNVPLDGILVSLSDREERLLNQTATDLQGKFSFSGLPPGLYWVTVRRRDANNDTAIFRHVVLTPAEPAGSIDFLLAPQEIYEARQILHKPVLIQVVDGSGAPLGNVGLDVTWSTGTVLDSIKGATATDGMVSLELIPGANYVTLKRRGCPKDDERLNVAEGPGIDGFKMVFDCSKK